MKTNIGKLLESAIHHRNSGGEFVLAGSPEHAMPALVMALTDSLLATALLELSSQRRTRDRDAVADARREKIDALLEEAIPVFRAQLERVSAEPHAAPPGYGMEGSPTCYACGVDASAVLELMGAVSTVVAHARIGEDPPASRCPPTRPPGRAPPRPRPTPSEPSPAGRNHDAPTSGLPLALRPGLELVLGDATDACHGATARQ
jgi:hypothetical protein